MLPAVLFLAALGQAATPATAEPALDRIRKALASPDAAIETAVTTEADRPVFRLEIVRKPPRPPWADLYPAVGASVKSWAPLYHHEFLEQVTPEEFRAAVLYPTAPTTPFGGVGIGIPVNISAVVHALKDYSRRRSEVRANNEVRAALEELDRARRAVGLSGAIVPQVPRN